MPDFELVAEVKPSFCPSVHLFKWKSRRTGLQAVLVRRQSPSVQGFFAVASEANDNSGCPHTLEHIVFMGSHKYPHKGLLDKLSAKQMSSTNAWTAQDHTCYTLTTAGHAGFMHLLPVYLDHILNATVLDSACLTEVYHIDGKGEEKGVVFSEMQGYEHTSYSLMIAEVQKLLYDSRSGYATNTGGSLAALRTLRPETIKRYHKDVYGAPNLSVIVAGDLEPEEMVESLSRFDSELPDAPISAPRPFLDSPLTTARSPLTQNTVKNVDFPDSMESSGEVLVSWIGPHMADVISNTAIQIVLKYLAAGDAGKLERDFVVVNKDAALASEVTADTDEYLYTQINLTFYGIPITKLSGSADRIFKYLESHLLENLDMDFLKQCIENVYDRFVLSAEEYVNTFVDLAICEFLYGKNSSFEEWLGKADEFDVLRSWSEESWRQFITKYFVQTPKACILGKPSRDEHIKVDEQKKQRLEEIKNTYDLEEEGRKLQQAIAENEKPIPENLLAMLPPPNFEKIRFITSQSAATQRLLNHGLPGAPLIIDEGFQKIIDKEACSLGLNFEHILSQFVNIKLYFSPRSVDKELFPLISVVLANAFAFPMKLDDGRRLSSEEVAQEAQRDLLSNYVNVDTQLHEFVSVSIKVKTQNYAKGIEWIKRVMFNVDFDKDNVAIFLARHLKNIPEAKRSDHMLLSSSMEDSLLTNESLRRDSDILVTEPFIRELEQDIDAAVFKMKELQTQLFRPENIRGLVVGDVHQIAKANGGTVLQPWKELEIKLATRQRSPGIAPIVLPSTFHTEMGRNPAKEAVLTLCAASDSTNLKIIARGPTEYGDPDLPALTLVNALLDMTEGPFWNAVRGPGYAYGASLSTSVQMGHVMLTLYSAADGISAYASCKSVVEDIVQGKYKIDETMLESAVATIVGDLAYHLAEPATAIEEKFSDTVIKGYAPNYTQLIIKELREVTPARFQAVLRQYVLPLFGPASSAAFAVAPPSEHAALESGLRNLGYEVAVREIEIDSDEEYSDAEDSGSGYESDESSDAGTD